MREVIHSFALSALVEGKRFCHVRWLTDDPGIATSMNRDRVRGEDALPRLGRGMSVETTAKWHGWSRERRVVIGRTLKPVNPSP